MTFRNHSNVTGRAVAHKSNLKQGQGLPAVRFSLRVTDQFAWNCPAMSNWILLDKNT